MDRSVSVWFVEQGCPGSVPGFKDNTPAAAFPFWGNHYFLDFALANFRGIALAGRSVVLHPRYRGATAAVAGRWEDETPSLRTLENGLDDLLTWLGEETADIIVLSSLSFVPVFDAADLLRVISTMSGALIKISVGHIPADLFAARRKRLIELLEASRSRLPASRPCERFLFEDILHADFELIENIPGRILFHNHVKQLYRENLWLIDHQAGAEHARIASRMDLIKAPDRETLIESGAFVRNSIIAAGATVEGRVEDSVIFPNVHIRKGARVLRSVVMNNNRIGSRAVVENAIIFPFSPDGTKFSSNIGEGVIVGTERSAAQNEQFPDQIQSGMTVLGMDVELPAGITVEPGCFVASEVTAHQLKGQQKLKRGSSVYPERRK